jgi:enediyne biosynthesis protein E4
MLHTCPRLAIKAYVFVRKRLILISFVLLGAFLQRCATNEPGFKLLSPDDTNVTFINEIHESDSFNVLLFEYIYNGGGVGIGDVNHDGLQDLFFTGNMVSSKLYLNRGDLQFEDVTEHAHVTTHAWCTGVAIIDINGDGLLDIHVSTIHPDKHESAKNLFFINKGVGQNGIPIYEEQAALLGVDDPGYSTQAAFLDYDRDGDLDMYLVNNALENFNRNIPSGPNDTGFAKSVDRLYQNNGLSHDGLPRFTDVSKEAGIIAEGWGLGLVVNDFNRDGYPDIYVSNDFLSNDHLYINQRDGTFKNEIASYFKHQEYNGMGMDVADINNDGLNDIMVTDMMPDDNLRQKTMFSSTGYDKFQLSIDRGYQPQYIRNVLQLNNGNNTFSDIGYLAGIYATDWSWSGLFADVDNDGNNDLLVTNGYKKDITDLDFTAYSKEAVLFGSMESRTKQLYAIVNTLQGVKKSNFIFHNNGDLTFTNYAKSWGMDQSSYSNGAAYADLDNDGDLDLVMNNINEVPFIYENNLSGNNLGNNFLRVKLAGADMNRQAIGAKVSLYYGGKCQFREHHLQRGYLSTVEPVVHFGLGKTSKVDSLVIVWPSGTRQVLTDLGVNTVIAAKETRGASGSKGISMNSDDRELFSEIHEALDIHHAQHERDFVDYKHGQPLLPHKHSQLGPAVAVADINQDGLDDFVVGAPASIGAKMFIQTRDGKFQTSTLPAKAGEDMGLLLFDADRDGDQDLYCVGGSTEFGMDNPLYADRFYRNNGGRFTLDTLSIPSETSSGSCVTACDFDKDGDLDLFIGGRISPTRYPYAPKNYLLENDGRGVFKDVTSQAHGLSTIGMVTAALWSDVDNDSWIDLVLVGEWMPFTIFKNKKALLHRVEMNQPQAASTVGWWNSINAGDFDNDGDVDYIAGNLGLNTPYKASREEPVCLYAKDFDENGSIDPVLCRYNQGKEYIVHPRETLTEQMVTFKKILTQYATYGQATFADLFPSNKLENALIYKAAYFSSAYFNNQGEGTFNMKALPIQAQFSPMFGTCVTDADGDGNLDVLTVGNSYSTEPLTGRYDAGIGCYLKGDGKGNFSFVPVTKSGFFVDGDAKAIATIQVKEKILYIVGANQDSIQVFNSSGAAGQTILLQDDDVHAIFKYANGQTQKVEFYYGAGYLSQSSRRLCVPPGAVDIMIYTAKGSGRNVPVYKDNY